VPTRLRRGHIESGCHGNWIKLFVVQESGALLRRKDQADLLGQVRSKVNGRGVYEKVRRPLAVAQRQGISMNSFR
jgi:hypothetical protein